VEGYVREIIRSHEGKVIVLELQHATIRNGGSIILVAPNYTMAVGEKIVSAFAGPADVEAFQPTATVPHEKMHKIHYDENAVELQKLYADVRNARANATLVSNLPQLWEKTINKFPEDWLLSLEILEILLPYMQYKAVSEQIHFYLQNKKTQRPDLANVITNGLKLLQKGNLITKSLT
jgi:phenylalanine-4-hydroxylase